MEANFRWTTTPHFILECQMYYNHHRTHSSLGGDTPTEVAGGTPAGQDDYQ